MSNLELRYELISTEKEVQRLLSWFNSDIIIIPFIQRESGKWNIEKKSLFIDSIMRGLPIPPLFLFRIYNAELEKQYYLVDGLQRLDAINWFINQNGTLKILDNKLNGKKFKDLLQNEKNILQEI